MRIGNRGVDELRSINIIKDYLDNPEGSVLIEMGDTKVICTAMIEEGVPFFLRGSDSGWLTAEYSMLPASTIRRKVRESSRGRIDGRTHEIQRMIGRVLRSAVDLNLLGEKTIWVDCDVIQADGGTRTASVTGAFVAVVDALNNLYEKGELKSNPIKNFIAGISVGLAEDGAILDMCFEEDHKAIVDVNLIMTDENKFIEIQGTGEEDSFSREELLEILRLGEIGIGEVIKEQKRVLSKVKILEVEND